MINFYHKIFLSVIILFNFVYQILNIMNIKGQRKTAIVIGAGFSGITAAAALAAQGWEVQVLEKNSTPGGRARVLKKDGFTFDMGPSWYWMPEVIGSFFRRMGTSVEAHLDLRRLDPSYKVIFSGHNTMEVPADMTALRERFESLEQGAGRKLDQFLSEARLKYEKGMGEFAAKPSLSIREFARWDLIRAAVRLDLFRSFSAHVRSYFRHPELLQLLEFPVLFLGAMPRHIPALYSMMNYADLSLGTWYPMGGFGKLVEAMVSVGASRGVEFLYNVDVRELRPGNRSVESVLTDKGAFTADVIISSADYHFTEQVLLPKAYRNYSAAYWEKRVMAPSCLLYYIGVNKKIGRLRHHNLFFENSFDAHAASIYERPAYPRNPLYYVCCPSRTDHSVAPEGMENLFLLIPVAPGLEDTPAVRSSYFEHILSRLEAYCGEPIKEHIISYTDYAGEDFIRDYNAYKGNAYGLANTLRQTALLKPVIKNRKLDNLYYTGQLTVPGPGVPPAILSGQLVADYIIAHTKRSHYETSL